MCRRLIFLISFVLVLGLAGTASADDIVWTNGSPDNNSWCNEFNWDPDNEPDSEDTVYINQIDYASPNRGPIIGIGCNAVATYVYGPEPALGNTQVMDVNTDGTVDVGTWSWRDGLGTAIININGSPTITVSSGAFRGTDNGLSIVNIEGTPNILITSAAAGDFRGGDGDGTFIVNMSGGYLDIAGQFIIGDNGGGEINMSGGTIVVGSNFDMGGLRGSVPVTINMTGGLIRAKGPFRLPGGVSRAGKARMNLDGGVFDCNEFVHGGSDDEGPTYTDDWRVDITEGELRIWGDVKAAIDANVAAEQITAYNYEGTVVVEVNDGNTVVTALPPDPNRALNPYPPHRSTEVDPNVDLSWTPGINAASHNVYFGTDFDDVKNGTGGTFRGNLELDANELDPNDDPCGLARLTTFYWRIDEVNDGNTWTGRVWRFTTRGDIIDPNMLLWYRFNEYSGYVAADASGYGNHGMVDGNEILWDPCNGHKGGSRIFDDKGDEQTVVDVPTTALSNIKGGITVSVWLKDAYNRGNDNWVFDTGYGGEEGPYHVYAAVVTKDEKDVLWRAGDDSEDVVRWNLGGANPATLQGWHYWAFVKSESQDKISIYFDGELAQEKSEITLNTLTNVRDKSFKIGATTWSDNWDYEGAMDEFKVYDYALSDVQIAEEFRGSDLELAWGPEPGDNEEDVLRDANLAWKAGAYVMDVNAHRLYFGTDYESVRDANTTVTLGVYKGDQNETAYDLPILDLYTTYYWRVDEVNDNDPNVWRGPIWRFTTADFLVVDNFEAYNKTTNLIHNTWRDYQWQTWNTPGKETGALLGLGIYPYDAVHAGSQSMKYMYLNYPCGGIWCPPGCGDIPPGYGIFGAPYAMVYYSEAWLPIPADQRDWTREDVKVLRLFFYGDPGNDTNDSERMFVGVEDGDGNYAEVRYGVYDSEEQDMNDLKFDEWQAWNIALVDFNDPCYASVVNDVDLTNITELYIGFGDKEHPLDIGNCGGQGIMLFDDIRLNLPVCVPKYGPVADLSGDCVVNIVDVSKMGLQWLNTDINFPDLGITVQQPKDANLVGHWKLDDGLGSTTAADDSDYHNTGTLEGRYRWVPGHIGPHALDFKIGGGRILVPDDGNTPELRPLHQVSASAWVKILEPMGSARIVVKGKNDKETYDLEVDDDEELVFNLREPNGTKHDVNGVVWPNDWIHLAGTYDGNSIKCYVNGKLQESKDINKSLSQDTTGLAIGNQPDANDNPFEGIIDDIRVYDYGLSAAEVAWLATEGSGFLALTSKANLFKGEDPEKINFKDFAMLMESWLDEKLWPQ